jgi:uncharacterized protein YkwD
MRKTISLAALLGFVALLPVLASAQRNGGNYDDQGEQQLVQLLNQERSRAGLPSLHVDDRLRQAARDHSRLMADRHQLSHLLSGEDRLPNRLAATGIRFNNDAENVAYDNSIEGAHAGLMHSPPHRANILGPKYNAVGIGVVRRGDVLWVTEDFAHQLEEHTAAEAESMIVAEFKRLRVKHGMPPVQTVSVPQLRDIACRMARQGTLDSKAPLDLPRVRADISFNSSDLAQLPSSAAQVASDPTIKSFGVAACFGASDKYPAGTFWVAMVFY